MRFVKTNMLAAAALAAAMLFPAANPAAAADDPAVLAADRDFAQAATKSDAAALGKLLDPERDAAPHRLRRWHQRPHLLQRGVGRDAALDAGNGRAGLVLDEARQCIARALRLDPGMRISNLKDRLGGRFPPVHFVRFVDGLRRAGLPE